MKARVPWAGSESQKSAMKLEIQRQLMESTDKYLSEIDAMILWTLHSRYGFGPRRLKQFYDAVQSEHKKLKEFYQTNPDGWLYTHLLKNVGIDIEKFKEDKNKGD